MAEAEFNELTPVDPATDANEKTTQENNNSAVDDDDEEFNISKYVLNAYQDATVLLHCGRFKIVLIIAVIFAYLAYGFSFYLDKKQNHMTTTEFVQIDSMRVPYYYVYASEKVFDLNVISIGVVDASGNLTKKWKHNDGIETIDAEQFNYDKYVSNSDKWIQCVLLNTVTIGSPSEQKQMQIDDGSKKLFIPPSGLKLGIGETLRLRLTMKSYPLDNYDNFGFGSGPQPVGLKLSDDLQTKYFNAFLYGLFWFADDVDLLTPTDDYTLNNFVDDTYSNRLQLYYTFLSTEYYAYMSLFNSVDNIEDTESYYYSFTPVGSLINYVLTKFDAQNISNTQYEVRLNFYPNPAGEGLMTQIIKQEAKSWTDVFSEVGGMFTVINAIITYGFGWLLLGVACWKGLAPNDSLDDSEKRKIRTYLHELKLIDDNKADENLQHTQQTALQKIDAKCCHCC
eukprot:476687_1